MIKFLDLKQQYLSIKSEIDESMSEVIDNECFILGKYVDRFETNIAKYIGVSKNQVITCANGSDALLLALMSIGVKEGDEIITTSFSFIATASCISRLGAKIVFIDINDELNIDVNLIEKNITQRTKAIISVDLYGKPCDQIEIKNICKKYNLFYISDSAQSIGSYIGTDKIGTIADFTTFSFFPSKNLSCYGDGGMIIALNEQYANIIKQLRSHGSSVNNKYIYDYIGINSRLDSLQANILNIKLKYLDSWISKRRQIAHTYRQLLKVSNPQSDTGHVYNQFTICINSRDDFQKYLNSYQIPSMVYYPQSLPSQKCFLNYNTYKNADYYSQTVLSIPIHENLSDDNIHFIIKTINAYFQ